MPSTNKTPNIGLNQWAGNEHPKKQDFNDDNLAIDNKIKEIQESIPGEAPVSSVNTKTGAVVLSASDIKTSSGATVEASLSDMATDITNINLDIKTLIKTKSNITVLSTGWVDDTATSGFYIYDITDADITATTVVDVNIKLVDLEKASDIKSSNESFDGYVRIYADTAPTENIICDLRLMKAVV